MKGDLLANPADFQYYCHWFKINMADRWSSGYAYWIKLDLISIQVVKYTQPVIKIKFSLCLVYIIIEPDIWKTGVTEQWMPHKLQTNTNEQRQNSKYYCQRPLLFHCLWLIGCHYAEWHNYKNKNIKNINVHVVNPRAAIAGSWAFVLQQFTFNSLNSYNETPWNT